MKKIFLILATLFCMGEVSAQVAYEMQVHDNGLTIFNTTTTRIDSIKFSNNNVVVTYNGYVWSRAVNDIDSVTFAQDTNNGDDTYGDTTAIDTTHCIRITWNNGQAVGVVNPWASQGVAITATGENVVVNATADTADLVYYLSGYTSNGSLTISSERKFILYMNGVSITNTSGPAILITSDKRAVIHLGEGTTNVLADAAGHAYKGALQSAGRFEIQGGGTMQVSGYTKHGIQSSGSTTMLGGNVQILTAVTDGMNVDNFIMYGGTINVVSSGDGIDGDQGYIEVRGGSITATCAEDGSKGLACDSTLSIMGGNIVVTMSGDDAKGLKSGQNMYITGGTVDVDVYGDQSKGIKAGNNMIVSGGDISINATGTLVLASSGSGYDPSYCTGIKVDGALLVSEGNVTVICPTSNGGGKAISCDSAISITGGKLNLTATGTSASYTNEDGETDTYSSTCLKSNSNIYISGGNHTMAAGGKAISTDGNFTMSGDSLTLSTNGTGFTIGGTGTQATDGFAPSCVKVDGNMYIFGGVTTATSTGKGGRGLVADGTLTIGQTGASNDLIHLKVYTSGAPVNTTSSGGWGSSTDYFKGLPKGIKIEDTIRIHSGYVSVYCSQTSGDPTAEAIESKSAIYIDGGEVEANSYDDAINAGTYLSISGGKVWAYSRGNDGIDCNGTYTYITGGTVVGQGKETGIDAGTDAGGHFYITGGTVVAIAGNMGTWDTPTMSGTQKYVSLNVTATSGFCLKNSSGNEVAVFKSPTVSGGGFQNAGDTGTKPPGGGGGGGGTSSGTVAFSSPNITSGTYTVYSSVSISGGTSWHGLYSGATCTTSGSSTSVTAQ